MSIRDRFIKSEMKRLEESLLLFYNSVIAGILTLLGFTTSCEKFGSGGIVCMYGTPAAKFIIKGNSDISGIG